MNKLFRQIGLMLILLVAISLGSCTSKYSYETVPNDPLKARIYTLDNGLKVYMTVNKETPRIQTYIAVRVGGKNDPAETTGLAHYFEHLMFKGSQKFGHKIMLPKNLCSTRLSNSSRYIVKQLMKQNVQPSIIK